ncbi:MAG: ECF transporter S component [Anaerolineae bacterium]
MEKGALSVRRIVVAGVLSAIAILLGWTRLGFIPVPTAAGNATIMHVPAIIGGILEGWVVGGIVGTLFGLFSFLNATVPLFKDPLVAVLPRVFIGVTTYFAYRTLRRLGVRWMLIFLALLFGLLAVFTFEVGQTSVWVAALTGVVGLAIIAVLAYFALNRQFEIVVLSVAAAIGTLTNTVLVLTMAVLRGYMAPGVAWTVGLTHGIPEIIVAAIITVAVVVAWKRIETGRGEAKM